MPLRGYSVNDFTKKPKHVAGMVNKDCLLINLCYRPQETLLIQFNGMPRTKIKLNLSTPRRRIAGVEV
jgi:hypothetical protein